MLAPALLVLALCGVRAATFNITRFIVPEVVPEDQDKVDLECHYDANFTFLNWFKGPNEFFRYKPSAIPITRTFPIAGVGTIDMMMCGPTVCRLRLGGLTEEASGLYRCDAEREGPPYLFATMSAHMRVLGHKHRKPIVEGLAREYGEDEEVQAYCRGSPGADFHWYVNGREWQQFRGMPTMKYNSSKFYFRGIPPTMAVQCAELRYGMLSGSKEAWARWKKTSHRDERAQEQRNASNSIKCLGLCGIFCVLINNVI